MYNTNFVVKYHDIQEELLEKNKTTLEYEDQDILDICDKLYRDELCSVFYAEDILDDKIDQGYKFVYDKMILNERFKSVISEINKILSDKNISDVFSKEENEQTEQNDNYDFFILQKQFRYDCPKCRITILYTLSNFHIPNVHYIYLCMPVIQII